MKDKFNYYDFIANIIPGIIFFWLLSMAGVSFLQASNGFEETLIFIVLSYVTGLIIQFLAKNIIERIAKFLFWDNRFYSEICLLKGSGRIHEDIRNNVIQISENIFNFSKAATSQLEGDFVSG